MYHYISLLYYVLCMLFWTSCVYTCVDEVCKLHIESHIVILHFEISSEWMGLNTQCMQFSSWWFDIPCISPGTVIKSSRFATSKDIITCSNMRPCDDVYTNIYIYIYFYYTYDLPFAHLNPWDLMFVSETVKLFFCWNRGQDRGGVVEREDPFMQLLQANKARMNGKDMMGVQLQLPGACWRSLPNIRWHCPKR